MDQPIFAGHTAEQANQFRAEALDRLRAVQSIVCTAAKWDQMLLLIDELARNQRHVECRDGDATKCLGCSLESQAETMLAGAI